MKLTRTLLLGVAFLMPSVVSTIAKAEDKPAAEAPAAEGDKKAKKAKKAKKEDKKEEGAAAAPAEGEKKAK